MSAPLHEHAVTVTDIASLGPNAGVALRPLTREDLPGLFAATPADCFRYFLAEPTAWTLTDFTTWADQQLFRSDQLPLAVVDAATGALLGSSSLMDIQAAHRHVEIGCTWYTASARGTLVNPACKLLMLEHAFLRMFASANGSPLGALRVTLKCDARNVHSQAAIAKLGAQREGTLRSHRMRPDGFVRDTVYFSILPSEWASVRAKLEARVGTYVRTLA